MTTKTYTMTAPLARRGDVIGRPTYPWERTYVYVLENAAEVDLVSRDGGETPLALKASGGAPSLSGEYLWTELAESSLVGTSATLTLTLSEASIYIARTR